MPLQTDYRPNENTSERILKIDDAPGGTQIRDLDAATTHVLIAASGGEMRFMLRGGTPTATHGHRIKVGESWVMETEIARGARFVSATPDHGELHITDLIERALLAIE